MKYEIVGPEHFEQCNAVVASTGNYAPMDFNDIGGIVLAFVKRRRMVRK